MEAHLVSFMKNKVFLIISTAITVIMLLLAVLIAIPKEPFYLLRNSKTETDMNSAAMVCHGNLKINNKTLNFNKKISESYLYVVGYSDSNIFFIKQIKQEKYGYSRLCLAKMDINTNSVTELFSDDFIESQPFLFLDVYNLKANIAGVFVNGNVIYMMDSIHAVSYDTVSGSVNKELMRTDVKFNENLPNEKEVYNKVIKNKSIGDSVLKFGKKHIFGSDCLMADPGDFVSDITLIHNEVFVTCKISNIYGEQYAVVFKYDKATKDFLYAGYEFVNDTVNTENFQIIPKFSEALS